MLDYLDSRGNPRTKGYSTYNLFIHCINTYCLFILRLTEVPIFRWGELSSCQEQQISDNNNATLSFVPWITIHSVDNNPLWNCTNMPAHPMPSTALSHAYLTINDNIHAYARTHSHTNICTSTHCVQRHIKDNTPHCSLLPTERCSGGRGECF